MRHRKSGRRLNRTGAHRQVLFRNLAVSLLRHEQIVTTLPKAKELRRFAEPLITLGKRPTLANRRLAFARLRDRETVGKLFDELGPRFKDRPGGYLRILKAGFRPGDAAPRAVVQLVERPPAVAPAAATPVEGRKPAKAKPEKTKERAKAKPPAGKKKSAAGAKQAAKKSKEKDQ